MAAIGKKKTRSTSRGWWWAEFTEHPGYENSEPASMVQQKAKVICTRLLERHIAAERVCDEREVRLGLRDHARDECAITGTGKVLSNTISYLLLMLTIVVWATGQQDLQRIWLVARPKTLMTHIRDCDLHTESIRSRARGELMTHSSPSRSARFNQPMQLAPVLSAPQLYDSSQITGPSLAAHSTPSHSPSSASASPALGLFIPGPSASASGPSSLLPLPSPLAFDSRAPSPAMSDISLLQLQIPAKRQRMSRADAYRSVSQPGISSSPHIGAHWSTSQIWTDADQADWEAGLARVTASAGLPLRWVENPEWLKLCDRFIPRAKVPSAKVLTKRVMPQVLRGIKVTAIEESRGAVGTLQCDGWTGENHHHLIGFMMTVKRKVSIACVVLHCFLKSLSCY